VIEITEQEAVGDYEGLCVAMAPSLPRGISMAGVRVAIDDTGAGYSNLRHVISLVAERFRPISRPAEHNPRTDIVGGATHSRLPQ
jgi:predicted signal transduction protein with EAL and GGDEF domain